jgi:hypothetical protein
MSNNKEHLEECIMELLHKYLFKVVGKIVISYLDIDLNRSQLILKYDIKLSKVLYFLNSLYRRNDTINLQIKNNKLSICGVNVAKTVAYHFKISDSLYEYLQDRFEDKQEANFNVPIGILYKLYTNKHTLTLDCYNKEKLEIHNQEIKYSINIFPNSPKVIIPNHEYALSFSIPPSSLWPTIMDCDYVQIKINDSDIVITPSAKNTIDYIQIPMTEKNINSAQELKGSHIYDWNAIKIAIKSCMSDKLQIYLSDDYPMCISHKNNLISGYFFVVPVVTP